MMAKWVPASSLVILPSQLSKGPGPRDPVSNKDYLKDPRLSSDPCIELSTCLEQRIYAFPTIECISLCVLSFEYRAQDHRDSPRPCPPTLELQIYIPWLLRVLRLSAAVLYPLSLSPARPKGFKTDAILKMKRVPYLALGHIWYGPSTLNHPSPCIGTVCTNTPFKLTWLFSTFCFVLSNTSTHQTPLSHTVPCTSGTPFKTPRKPFLRVLLTPNILG